MTAPAPAAPTSACAAAASNAAASAARVPGRPQDDGPGVARALEDGQPVAAPAGRRVADASPAPTPDWRSQTPSGTPRTCPGSVSVQPVPEVAQRGPWAARHVDRLLARGVLLRVEDLLGRARHLVVERVDARPAVGRLHRHAGRPEPGRVREEQAVDEDLRRPLEDRQRLGVGARPHGVLRAPRGSGWRTAHWVISSVASPS